MYDKRSNGHCDYERLAEEVLHARAKGKDADGATAALSHEMLQRAENYIDTVMQDPEADDQPETDSDEGFPAGLKSSYPEMVQAMEFGSGDGTAEATQSLRSTRNRREKHPSAVSSSFVIATYGNVRLIPQDSRLASGCF